MKASEIEKQLEINKKRQEIIDALLIAREHSDEIQTIKALSKDAKAEIIEKFHFSSLQAQAIIDIKKRLFLIPEESIAEERESLRTIEAKLKLSSSRKLSTKIADILLNLKSFVGGKSNKYS